MPALRYWDGAASQWKDLVVGMKGDKGDPGPQGPPATTYLNSRWTFSQGTVEPPVAGTVRMDADTYAAATALWVHEFDEEGLDRSAGLGAAVVGDQIIMQSPQGRVVWEIADVVDAGVYRTFTVTYMESSGVRPDEAASVTLYLAVAGGSPGGGR